EVTFGEASNAASAVQGSYLSHSAGSNEWSCPGAFHDSGESRDQTLANARQRIQQVQGALRSTRETRWYTLTVEHRFTKGRRSELVVTVCVYIACRMNNSSPMLIEFSDMLQVGAVVLLGKEILILVQIKRLCSE
ncbi:hypothetical protein K439DRAFT_1528539, partial [Ramaria rubella]